MNHLQLQERLRCGVQGHVLSRLAMTQHPDDDKQQTAEAAPQEASAAAAGSLQMTDLEAEKHGAEAQHQKQSDADSVLAAIQTSDGGKHGHQVQFGGKAHGGRTSVDHSSKANMSLWDDMLKRKVAADMEKQKSKIPDDASVTHSEDSDQMSRASSTAALLGEGMGGSDRVAETLAGISQSPAHQQPAPDQSRVLSKKGILRVLSNGRRFLPSALKKTDSTDEGVVKGGLTHQSGGGGVSRMGITRSADSTAQLLPAGMHSGWLPCFCSQFRSGQDLNPSQLLTESQSPLAVCTQICCLAFDMTCAVAYLV